MISELPQVISVATDSKDPLRGGNECAEDDGLPIGGDVERHAVTVEAAAGLIDSDTFQFRNVVGRHDLAKVVAIGVDPPDATGNQFRAIDGAGVATDDEEDPIAIGCNPDGAELVAGEDQKFAGSFQLPRRAVGPSQLRRQPNRSR